MELNNRAEFTSKASGNWKRENEVPMDFLTEDGTTFMSDSQILRLQCSL